jgi:hypothetical protein
MVPQVERGSKHYLPIFESFKYKRFNNFIIFRPLTVNILEISGSKHLTILNL